MKAKIGSVIFFDIVGYSVNHDPMQVKITQKFMKCLAAMIGKLWKCKLKKNKNNPYIILPTGDGAAIIIFDAPKNFLNREIVSLYLAARVLIYAKINKIGIRCGIYSGEIDIINDPYGDINVSGSVINMASRIMDAANSGQVLAHSGETGFIRRLGDEKDYNISNMHFKISESNFEVLAKHNVLLPVKSITGQLKINSRWTSFGDKKEPEGKWHLQIEPPILTYDQHGILQKKIPPFELLIKHKKLAFIGANNNTLLESFKKAIKNSPKKVWDSIDIFFLSDEKLNWITTPERTVSQLIKEKNITINNFNKLLSKYTKSYSLYEFESPFYFASYWDWEQKGGRIHVSTQIWGIDIKIAPALDYIWKTSKPTKQYNLFKEGLENLKQISKKIINLED